MKAGMLTTLIFLLAAMAYSPDLKAARLVMDIEDNPEPFPTLAH
jgi:hypothetical protein